MFYDNTNTTGTWAFVTNLLGAAATTRASFAAYSTAGEVDALLNALDRVPAIFGVEVPA